MDGIRFEDLMEQITLVVEAFATTVEAIKNQSPFGFNIAHSIRNPLEKEENCPF